MNPIKRAKFEIICPCFPGFYESIYSFDAYQEIDFITEDIYDTDKIKWVEENIYDFINYKQYEQDVSRFFVDTLFDFMKKNKILSDTIFVMKYNELVSPREYNFNSDTILMEIQLDYEKLIDKFYNHPKSREFVKDNFTSCDGFLSFVPNKLEEFIEDNPERIITPILQFFIKQHNNSSLAFKNVLEPENFYEDVFENILLSEYIDFYGLLKELLKDEQYNTFDFFKQKEEELGTEYEDGEKFVVSLKDKSNEDVLSLKNNK